MPVVFFLGREQLEEKGERLAPNALPRPIREDIAIEPSLDLVPFAHRSRVTSRLSANAAKYS